MLIKPGIRHRTIFMFQWLQAREALAMRKCRDWMETYTVCIWDIV